MMRLLHDREFQKKVGIQVLIWALICVFLLQVVNSFLHSQHVEDAHHELLTWLQFLLILVVPAKIIEALVQRAGLPGVLGALGTGVLIRAIVGNEMADDMITNVVIIAAKDWGAIQLLFNTGLESNLTKMMKDGPIAAVVALVGVLVPFTIGWLWVGPWYWPEASGISHVMAGATLVATSVGITASILKDLGLSDTPVGRILIAAAVFDDVLGVLFLVGSSAAARGEAMSFNEIIIMVLQSFGFLAGSIALGYKAAPYLSKFFSRIHPGNGMRMALSFGLYGLFALLAGMQGLEPLLGSFCAGLVLDPVHFSHFAPGMGRSKLMFLLEKIKLAHQMRGEEVDELDLHELQDAIEETAHHEVEELFLPLSQILVTVFFVYTGLQLRLDLLNWHIIQQGVEIALLAAAGKVIAGFVVPGSWWKKFLIGLGMVARGEVGLIFAAAALGAKAFNQEQFATVLVVVVVTTLIPALFFKMVAKRLPAHETVSEN